MIFYKIVKDNELLSVVTSDNLRKYQKKHNILLFAEPNEAQYMQTDDGRVFRDGWMVPTVTKNISYEEADVIMIDEGEFNLILKSIEDNEPIPEEFVIEQTEEPVPVIEDTDTTSIEYVKGNKLNELRNSCTRTIQSGADITLSDGETHHYSLSITDQLNLIDLNARIVNGASEVVYHADEEEYSIFSADEIKAITETLNKYKDYHLTYHNALKRYVNSLDDINTISEVYYGMEIPEEYETEAYKKLKNTI